MDEDERERLVDEDFWRRFEERKANMELVIAERVRELREESERKALREQLKQAQNGEV